jgi:phage terminase small subunit
LRFKKTTGTKIQINTVALFEAGEVMANDLTPKQEKFVEELIKGKSQREAYKIAYNAKRMKDTTIDSHASRTLKIDKVKARYDELRGKVVKRAEEKAIITAEEILKEIVSIAKDNISNYLDFRTEKTVVGHDKETGEPIIDYAPIVDIKDSRTINTKNVSEISVGANGTFKFKTYCRDTALYKLAEIIGMDELKKAKQKLAEDRFEHEKDIDSKRYW